MYGFELQHRLELYTLIAAPLSVSPQPAGPVSLMSGAGPPHQSQWGQFWSAVSAPRHKPTTPNHSCLLSDLNICFDILWFVNTCNCFRIQFVTFEFLPDAMFYFAVAIFQWNKVIFWHLHYLIHYLLTHYWLSNLQSKVCNRHAHVQIPCIYIIDVCFSIWSCQVSSSAIFITSQYDRKRSVSFLPKKHIFQNNTYF